MFNFEQAAQAMDRAAAAGSLQEEQAAVFDALKHREEIQIALCNAALSRCSGPPPGHERLALKTDDGDDWGRIEARIPKALYYGLRHQKNFGEDGLTSDDGMKELLKAFPQCRVKTISGKTTVGWTGASKRPNKNRVSFGRGTLQLAT